MLLYFLRIFTLYSVHIYAHLPQKNVFVTRLDIQVRHSQNIQTELKFPISAFLFIIFHYNILQSDSEAKSDHGYQFFRIL